MPRKATFSDYFALQGGRPIINQDEETGLWHIHHQYREDEPLIVTHISPSQRGTIFQVIGKEIVELDVAYLWDYEGSPCEQKSLEVGGDPYPRKSGIER
jgi:hypothetical protein